MNKYIGIAFGILIVLLASCQKRQDAQELMSLQFVDRNGFSETISTPERLGYYSHMNFLESQPYNKVVRLFKRNQEGKVPSVVTSYHDNGHIWQYLEVVNGRANGIYQEWHANGTLKIKAKLIEGMGDLTSECMSTWVFDEKNEVFDDKGRLLALVVYDKGELSGESIYYHPHGQIKKITPFLHHQIHGIEKLFDEEGILVGTLSYKMGNKDGESIYLGSSYCPKFSEKYENGLLLDGSYYNVNGDILSEIHEGYGLQSIFKEGKLVSQIEFRKGIPEGKVLLYDAYNQVESEYITKNDLKHGEEWIYQKKAQDGEIPTPKMFLTWYEGQLQGRAKTWYQDGTLESEREFYHNKKHGPSFAFYKDGSLMMIEEYENDQLVKGTYMKKGEKSIASTVENGEGTVTLFDADGILLRRIPYSKGQPVND